MDLANAPDPALVGAQLQGLERWAKDAASDPKAAEAKLPDVAAALRAVNTAMRGLIPEIGALLADFDAGRATVAGVSQAIGGVMASARRCPHLKL